MDFRVISSLSGATPSPGRFYLLSDEWNDWFTYVTQFRLFYFDEVSERHVIGDVKIGQIGMKLGTPRPEFAKQFEALPDNCFSLGQDDSYYENLNELGAGVRDGVLAALKDLAANDDLLLRALAEDVTHRSLLRSVSLSTVRGQFRRMTRGQARLTDYRFSFVQRSSGLMDGAAPRLEFVVTPESLPPTNVHVLVGRNGVGKTRLLGGMTRSWLGGDAAADAVGDFVSLGDNAPADIFAGLVTVAFSAFDAIPPLSKSQLVDDTRRYAYVGLSQVSDAGRALPPKDANALGADFAESLRQCGSGARRARLAKALEALESDPLFAAAEIAGLLSAPSNEPLEERAAVLFGRLSAGHKIVLLTMTRLVELVEEKTLVLLDEPESHLHPPLMAAFVRALSDLLVQRNGVAIVATHSPVILQEVPRSCVWKIRRTGNEMVVERPTIETFGENVGVLTREVFGLEVSHAGYHRMLSEQAQVVGTYEELRFRFGGQLGAEADAIVRALTSARRSE